MSDPFTSGRFATVTVSSGNVRPVANAGNNTTAVVGNTVVLDGSGSTDGDLNPLTFQWSFTTVPAGSSAAIADPITAQTSFVPDLPGIYVVQLIVNDGLVNSTPSTVRIDVTTQQALILTRLIELQSLIASLNDTAFRTPGVRSSMVNLFDRVIRRAQNGAFRTAKTLTGVVGRTADGCARQGAPDTNDLIVDCGAQATIQVRVSEIIALLGQLPSSSPVRVR